MQNLSTLLLSVWFFLVTKKRKAFISSHDLYFHPLIIEFVCFVLLQFKIEEEIQTMSPFHVSKRGTFKKLFCLGANELPRGRVYLGELEGRRKL